MEEGIRGDNGEGEWGRRIKRENEKRINRENGGSAWSVCPIFSSL